MDKLYKMVNGIRVEMTPEEEGATRAEWEGNSQNFEDMIYKLNRQNEYPPIVEQLDMLYHDKANGTNNWFESIKNIKAKYPRKTTNNKSKI